GGRRRVYLRVGYRFYADQPIVDRVMQLRNPVGNPSLAGDMSLIGGFVMTRYPNPHYLKRFMRFWRPETRDITLSWGGTNVTLVAKQFTDLTSYAPASTDVLIGWADQPITLSGSNAYATGRSATLSNVGPSDNQDSGVCLCTVHGGIEMGGGLI